VVSDFFAGVKLKRLIAGTIMVLAISLACSLAQGPAVAFAVEPERPGQGSFLTRAVVVQGQLWTLSDAGVLSSVKLDSRVMLRQGIAGAVLDLCVRTGSPQIAVANRGNDAWAIQHLSNGKWLIDGVVKTRGDQFIALDCSGNDLTVLMSRRLIVIHRGAQRVVTLSKKLVPYDVASVFGTSKNVFVGINAGEWGGGLRRIDRQTGGVTVIARNVSGALCDGPLNTDCDPVTAIASDPWNDRCVVIAIGLEHMASHGRIDEVCGDSVRRVYYKKVTSAFRADCKEPSGEPCETVAFFGIAQKGDEVLAVGNDGLYQIRKDGSATYSRLPKFVTAGDVYLSYDLPGFVLVLTDVNKRRSVSGSVPLLIPR
jgi:hypothetical protein